MDAQLDAIADSLVGDYFSAADGGVAEGRPVYLRIRKVSPPPGHRLALYSEMRHDGVTGEFYRQRLYLFDDTPDRTVNTSAALAFEDPAKAAGLMTDPALLVRESLATKDPLGPGCLTHWRADEAGFEGVVDPAACLITGKRGDQRRIQSITRITPKSINQLERGFDLDGKLLFGSPTSALYVWPRVK